MAPILTIFKLNFPYFDREFEYKYSKIISSSNKTFKMVNRMLLMCPLEKK